MEPRISLITLGVADLARAIAFYRDGLGLPQHGDYPGVAFFSLRGTWLSLYGRADLAADVNMPEAATPDTAPEGGARFSGITLAHNVRSKEEVDALLQHAASVGATIVKPAREAEWGGYSGYFADPDGHLWEVAWNPGIDLT